MAWDVRLIRQVLATHSEDVLQSLRRGVGGLDDAASTARRAADVPIKPSAAGETVESLATRRHDGASRALGGFSPLEPNLGSWLNRADLPKHVADDVDRALSHVTEARAAYGRSDYGGVADRLANAHTSALRAQSGFEQGLDELAEGIVAAAREGSIMGMRAAG